MPFLLFPVRDLFVRHLDVVTVREVLGSRKQCGIECNWDGCLNRVVVNSHPARSCCIFGQEPVLAEPSQPVDRSVPLSLFTSVANPLRHGVVVIKKYFDLRELDSVGYWRHIFIYHGVVRHVECLGKLAWVERLDIQPLGQLCELV